MDKLNEVIFRSDFFPSDDRKFWNRESSKGVDVLGIHLQISVQCFTGSLMDFWPALVAYSCEQRLAASLDCFHEELLTYLFIEDFLRISYIYINFSLTNVFNSAAFDHCSASKMRDRQLVSEWLVSMEEHPKLSSFPVERGSSSCFRVASRTPATYDLIANQHQPFIWPT